MSAKKYRFDCSRLTPSEACTIENILDNISMSGCDSDPDNLTYIKYAILKDSISLEDLYKYSPLFKSCVISKVFL